jgi:predicted phage terminase large subunit-like protein
MKLTLEIIKRMHEDKDIRRAITKRSLEAFFGYYYSDYIKYGIAPFHEQMFKVAQDENIKLIVIKGFRESAKSTIMAQVFPIWSAVSGRANEIVMICKNQMLVRHGLKNVRDDLEENELLIKDHRPFDFQQDSSGAYAITLSKYHAEIIGVSRDQSIRGIRHRHHRPDLIVIDDPDDPASVKTEESRNETWNWFMRDIVPLGHRHTRIVVIGSPLHQDSLVMRLSRSIEAGLMKGVVLNFPIIDEQGKPTWPAKFATQTDIEEAKMRVDEQSWQREYMLRIIPEDGQIIHEDSIAYYDKLPELEWYNDYRFSVMGVDLAIGELESNDYTAVVSAHVFGSGKDRKIYILPNPVNERLNAPSAVERVNSMSRALGKGIPTKVFVEDVGYQRSFIQYLKEKDIPVEGFMVSGHDKRSRLQTAAPLIQSGAVLFPRHGCEGLLTQVIGFGVERHDDLVDALTIIVLKLITDDSETGRILFPRSSQLQPPIPAEEQRDADEENRLLQEAHRSGDKTAWQKYKAFVQLRATKNGRIVHFMEND